MQCICKGQAIEIEIWDGQVLAPLYALDTETELIVDGKTPSLVLGSAYDGKTAYIIPKERMPQFLALNTKDGNRILMHTACFDINVLAQSVGGNTLLRLLSLVDTGNLLDIAILYRLVKLAQTGQVPPRYSLDKITLELAHFKLDKNELIRTTFGDGNLTEDHIVYAAKDAVATYKGAKVLLKQAQLIEDGDERKMLGHRLQLQSDIALYAMRKKPVHVDMDRVRPMKRDIERGMLRTAQTLIDLGYSPHRKGTMARYSALITPILEGAGIPLVHTSSGTVSSRKEYLMPVYDHPFVRAYLDYEADKKLVSTFLKPLLASQGVIYPNYELLMATGRTSCRKPNIQQQPRQGGVRQCIVPPEDHVFVAADYSWIELCTLGQYLINMFGTSTLADMLNSGEDPHFATASLLLNKKIRNVTKGERQQAKALNFGIAGGLSAAALKGYAAASYGVEMSDKEAVEWRDKWLRVYPDVAAYLNLQWDTVVFPCGRRRSNCTFTVAHNTPFQGIASDGAKRALYLAYRRGLQSSIFVHDEIIITSPVSEDYTEAASVLSNIMIEGMQAECPDILIGVEAYAMDRWYKSAGPVVKDGKLLCYKEEEDEHHNK
jgi:DNA polymerase-1